MKYNGLIEKIEKLALGIRRNPFKDKSKRIRDLILRRGEPKDIISEVEGYLSNLNTQYVSVRSFAISEDSLKKALFAGMHGTF